MNWTTSAMAMLLLVAGGVMEGSFGLPMNLNRRWKWENNWLGFSLLAFLLLPLATTLAGRSFLLATLHGTPPYSLLMIGLFGFGWGLGAVLFGMGIDLAGLALGMTVMTALTDALGTLVPMAVLSPAMLHRRAGFFIMAGTVVTIVGVVACAWAGYLREQRDSTEVASRKASLGKALFICVVAGTLSAMFNFGYAFSAPMIAAARHAGASANGALNDVWLIELGCGFLPNLLYCGFLLRRNGTWNLYRGTGRLRSWAAVAAMGILWFGGVVLYGMASDRMGALGPSLGWAVWNAIMIAASVGCGLVSGEWTGASRRSLQVLWGGTALLILSVAVLGLGGAGAV